MDRLLVVDVDPIRSDMHFKALLQRGYSLVKTIDLYQGIKMLSLGRFGVAIIDGSLIKGDMIFGLNDMVARGTKLLVLEANDNRRHAGLNATILVNPSLDDLLCKIDVMLCTS